MEPSTQRVIDQTWYGVSKTNIVADLSNVPAVVNQIALNSKGMPSFIPRFVYNKTA
jgi:hypothetical protein